MNVETHFHTLLMPHRLTIALLCLGLLCGTASRAQKKFLRDFRIHAVQAAAAIPPSNSISQISVQDTQIWIGTSKGLARSANGGRSWALFKSDPSFAHDGIFALDLNNDTIWAATGYEKEIDIGGETQSVQTGSGYAFSTNGGNTWLPRGQPIDPRSDSILRYGINDSLWILPVVVPEQNVTFDISLTPGTIWITSWSSGLRKSTDEGGTWQRIPLPAANLNSLRPTDTLWTYAAGDSLRLHKIFLRIDPRPSNPYANNYLAFAVHAIDSDTIWCGTAGGVNKSTDGGNSWVKFNHQNQVAGILGNWVIAINHQQYRGRTRIWTTNWTANDPDEKYGVSYTDDGGRTWINLLHGVKAYDFAFKDSIVYIATDDGVYRTADGGASLVRFSSMTDPVSHQIVATSQVFALGIVQDTVFIGTGDGLASTIDNATNQFGSSWRILRSYVSVAATASSYAYPNPFSPNFGPVRIHYFTSGQSGTLSGVPSVSIDIFDYGMNRVRSLLHDAARTQGLESDELWDGRNDDGKIVANGVYFYRIKISGNDDASFGKILVLQ